MNTTIETVPKPASITVRPELSAERRLATFAVLSALSVLAWHAQTAVPFGLDSQTLGFVLALIVLLRPFSTMAFFSLALVETVAIVIALPATNTNRLLQLFVYGSIASTGVYAWARNRFRRLEPAAWSSIFQPLLRTQLVIVYCLAAWDKLNFGFLNSQSSCAVLLYEETPFWHLHASAAGLRWALIAGTILTEAGLPVLLSIRRTRNFAVCYGAAFHIGLGFSDFYSFSMTMISLLFLFTPEHFCDAAADWWGGAKESLRRTVKLGLAAVIAIVALLTLLKFGPRITGSNFPGLYATVNIVWVKCAKWVGYWLFLLYLVPLGFFVWLWRRQPRSFTPIVRPFASIPAGFWLIPALLIFDGLNPYLGLKTETSFAMYSNLRTEGGQSNHLLWRHPLTGAGYQQDLVQVVDSSDTGPHHLPKGLYVPFMELRQRVLHLLHDGRHDLSVTYIRNGKLVSVASAKSDPELSARPSFLERKLLIFREIRTEGCPH